MGNTNKESGIRSLEKWTLAQDTSLFEHLEEFTKRVMARTAVTQKLLQTAIKDCQRSHIRFQACLNSFNMLSNTQFMESRVREEDSNTVKPKDHVQEPSNITGTQDNPENQRITELREVVALTKLVLLTSFDVVEVNVEDSDEEESPSSKRTFREPKDPYLRRPLPYLIDSTDFHRDRFIGLKLQADDKETVDEDDLILTPRLDDILVPNSSQTSLAGEPPFGSESLSKFGREMPRSYNDLRNIGCNDGVTAAKSPKAGRKSTIALISSDSEDDIFATHPIHKPKMTPEQSAKPISKTDSGQNTPPLQTPSSSPSSVQSSNTAKQTSSLFDVEDEEDGGLFGNNKSNPKHPSVAGDLSTNASSSLSSKPSILPRSTASEKTSRTASIFDDGEDREDLFSVPKAAPAKPATSANPLLSELSKKLEVSAPVPGASKLQLPSRTNPSIPSAFTATPHDITIKSKSNKIPKKPSLFYNDDDNDLFAEPAKTVITSKTPPVEEKEEKLSQSMGIPAKIVFNSETVIVKKPEVKARGKQSIFDDDEDDDIFAKKPTVTPNNSQSASQEVSPPTKAAATSRTRKKPLPEFLDDSDEEKEDFTPFGKQWKLPGLTRAPEKEALAATQPLSTEIPTQRLIDLPMSQEIPPPVSVTKEEPAPFSAAVRKEASSNVFDDDSDSEDLFGGSSKPIVRSSNTTVVVKPVIGGTKMEDDRLINEKANIEEKPQKETSSSKFEKWKLPELSFLLPAKDTKQSSVSVLVLEITSDPKVVAETRENKSVATGKAAADPDDLEDDDDGLFQRPIRTHIPFERKFDQRMSSDADNERFSALGSSELVDPLKSTKPAVPLIDKNPDDSPYVKKMEVLGRGDLETMDFAKPQLEPPPPKTAPAALHSPMKWKLPGLTVTPTAAPIDKTDVPPADTGVARPQSLEKPANKPPVPVPRRRVSPKPASEMIVVKQAYEEPPPVEPKTRSRASSGVSALVGSEKHPTIFEDQENGEKMLFSGEQSLPEKTSPVRVKSGNTIPLIPEMTLDYDSPPTKPQVASRRITPRKEQSLKVLPSSDPLLSTSNTEEAAIEGTSPGKESEADDPLSIFTKTSPPQMDVPVADTIQGISQNDQAPPMDPLQSLAATVIKPDNIVINKSVGKPPEKTEPVFNFTMPEPLNLPTFQATEPPPLTTLSSSLSSSHSSLKNRGGSLFVDGDEDSDEDLFKSPPKTYPMKTKLPVSTSRKSSLLTEKGQHNGDSSVEQGSDPLGSGKTKAGSSSTMGKVEKKGVFEQGLAKKAALFDSDDEDLFASSANATHTVAQSLADQATATSLVPPPMIPENVRGDQKKPALFDDDDDLFKN